MSNSDNQDWRAVLAEQQRRRNAILDPQHSNKPATPSAGQKPNTATTNSVPQQQKPASSENIKTDSAEIASTTSGTEAGASSESESALGGLRRRRSYSETVRSTPSRPYTRYAFENI